MTPQSRRYPKDRRRMGSKKCPFCKRRQPLTYHHLIPRKLHRRKRYRKLYNRQDLNRGIDICRMCHNGIHRLFDETTLGDCLNTPERLLAEESLRRHIRWVAKQRRRIDE